MKSHLKVFEFCNCQIEFVNREIASSFSFANSSFNPNIPFLGSGLPSILVVTTRILGRSNLASDTFSKSRTDCKNPSGTPGGFPFPFLHPGEVRLGDPSGPSESLRGSASGIVVASINILD